MQRELYSVTDLRNLCRGLALAADPDSEQGAGYLRALAAVLLALGVPVEGLRAELDPGARARTITAQRAPAGR